MQTQPPWCDHRACADFGKIGGPNIKGYSSAERRYYCTTCSHTCNAASGTFFETVRTERPVILNVMAMVVERNRLRAICRIKHCNLATALHWLDLAGHQAAAVSHHFIMGLHLTQAQIDELWTFIQKTRNTFKRVIPMISGMPGFGELSLCPGACVLCRISLINVVRKKRAYS
jgi:hypothetical protein